MKYVLIIVIWSKMVAVTEFDDKQACETANKEISMWYKNDSYFKGFCLAKTTGKN